MAKKYEDSAADRKADAKAKPAGMKMAAWEKSAADKKMDKAGAKMGKRK